MYGDPAPSFTKVKFWAAKFKSKTASTDDNIAQVDKMELDNYRIKVKDIEEAMNLSKERIYHVLNQNLGIRKLSACWVPRLLSLDQRQVRMNIFCWRRTYTLLDT